MRFMSVCSGIEAASEAWVNGPLGWECVGVSEVDPFACAVLAHRWGATRPMHPTPEQKKRGVWADGRYSHIQWGLLPNFGDFTVIREFPQTLGNFMRRTDVLVGGTPCQSFSLAGLRKGLSDDRGNLTLQYILLANAIDDLRLDDGSDPAWIAWENVEGVLSTPDNAFGTFLAGLVGSDAPIAPPTGGSWPGAGVVDGPRRAAAWRVLDARCFGLPQRRRRVIVLARGGDRRWDCADALLPVTKVLPGRPEVDRPARRRTAPDGPDGLGDRGWNEVAIAFKVRAGKPGGGKGYLGSADALFTLTRRDDQLLAVGEFAGDPAPAVRRMTPREAERAQGFPDFYTLVPFATRRRPPSQRIDTVRYLMREGFSAEEADFLADCSDDMRKAALGNSMPVPMMEYLGRRIALIDKINTPKPLN